VLVQPGSSGSIVLSVQAVSEITTWAICWSKP
jgi:hypothetical protein